MRPTRFCAKCGEYVEERDEYPVPMHRYGGTEKVRRLVHIDANGARIYRAHAAVEETNEPVKGYPRLP